MPSDFANLLLTERLAAFIALHPAVALELALVAAARGSAGGKFRYRGAHGGAAR
jgi:hypothetical protein